MADFLGIGFAERFHAAYSGRVDDCTLIQTAYGARTSISAGQAPTDTSYAAKGWESDVDERHFPTTLVEQGDREVSILGASIASDKIPEPGNKVTIGGVTYAIVRVKADAARAVYRCLARGA